MMIRALMFSASAGLSGPPGRTRLAFTTMSSPDEVVPEKKGRVTCWLPILSLTSWSENGIVAVGSMPRDSRNTVDRSASAASGSSTLSSRTMRE